MALLGIDPGSLRMGWGLVASERGRLTVVEVGVVRPRAGMPLPERLAVLHAEVSRILASYEPEAVAIETVFHGPNVRALVTLGQARGAIVAALGARGLPLFEISPSEVKKAVTGRGSADKSQVAQMVGLLLGAAARARLAEAALPADATDALAVAIAGLHRRSNPLLGVRAGE
jgi:crossover junction endodeoxyribonuclease RuvC